MTEQLQKALDAIAKLSPDEQDRWGAIMLEELRSGRYALGKASPDEAKHAATADNEDDNQRIAPGRQE